MLHRMLDAAISAPGRQQLAQAFKLCDASNLSDREAVLALQRDVLYTYQGFAQVGLGSFRWDVIWGVQASAKFGLMLEVWLPGRW
jgi:hypothetical protein